MPLFKVDSNIFRWINNQYSPFIFYTLEFVSKPKADEVIEKIDDFAKNKTSAILEKEDVAEYLILTNNYTREKTKGKIDNQTLSDIISYKMFILDELIFTRVLDNYGVSYAKGRFKYKSNTIRDYFIMWMDSVSP